MKRPGLASVCLKTHILRVPGFSLRFLWLCSHDYSLLFLAPTTALLWILTKQEESHSYDERKVKQTIEHPGLVLGRLCTMERASPSQWITPSVKLTRTRPWPDVCRHKLAYGRTQLSWFLGRWSKVRFWVSDAASPPTDFSGKSWSFRLCNQKENNVPRDGSGYNSLCKRRLAAQ